MFSFQKQAENRIAFTLIELLLVMAIIGVLSSLALVVVGEAQFDSQRNATQSRINQIDAMMQQRMEDYQVRQIPVDDLVEEYINISIQDDNEFVYAREVARRIMMEVISFEMPRSFDNVALNMNNPGVNTFPSQQFRQWVNDNSADYFRTGKADQLIRDLEMAVPFAADRFRIPMVNVIGAYPDGNETDPNSEAALIRTSSEYLFLVLQATELNGILAIESLSQRAFADTDNDGYLEVVDYFGNPIGFRFEMYDDEGNLVPGDNPDLSSDLESDYVDQSTSHPSVRYGVPVRNIQIRIFSTGDGVETISN